MEDEKYEFKRKIETKFDDWYLNDRKSKALFSILRSRKSSYVTQNKAL